MCLFIYSVFALTKFTKYLIEIGDFYFYIITIFKRFLGQDKKNLYRNL